MQNKFLQSALGIKSYRKTSPLLKALKLDRISKIVEIKKKVIYLSQYFIQIHEVMIYVNIF